MAENHVLLETIELTQSAASVTFDNIPQTGYTDLKIVAAARTDRALEVDSAVLRFNGDTTSGNYTGKRIYGTGSTVASDTNPAGLFTTGANATSNTYGNSEVYIPGYTSNTAKSFSFDNSQESNGSTSYLSLQANSWAGTAAIYQIVLTPEVGTIFNSGSTFSLYGIAATGTTPTIAPKATGGNVIANDGTYWYHAFLTSGYFTPQTSLTCDVLTVAGGGGGSSGGGGGGAGGLVYSTANALTATNYGVTVGAGGAGAYENKGSNGSDSRFSSLTAAVGGGAGGTDYVAGFAVESGNSGGSGGGAGQNPTAGGTFGTGTSGQGNNGGTGSTGGGAYGGGGGGGATAAGGNGNTSIGGAGGSGSSTYSSWGVATSVGHNVSGTYWFAGGGAAGTNTGSVRAIGGNGGGGNGGLGTAQPGFAGMNGTGGGGGASSGGAGGGYSAAGGSGVVIIRYPMA